MNTGKNLCDAAKKSFHHPRQPNFLNVPDAANSRDSAANILIRSEAEFAFPSLHWEKWLAWTRTCSLTCGGRTREALWHRTHMGYRSVVLLFLHFLFLDFSSVVSMFLHFGSLFFIFLFSGAQNLFFWPQLLHDFW